MSAITYTSGYSTQVLHFALRSKRSNWNVSFASQEQIYIERHCDRNWKVQQGIRFDMPTQSMYAVHLSKKVREDRIKTVFADRFYIRCQGGTWKKFIADLREHATSECEFMQSQRVTDDIDADDSASIAPSQRTVNKSFQASQPAGFVHIAEKILQDNPDMSESQFIRYCMLEKGMDWVPKLKWYYQYLKPEKQKDLAVQFPGCTLTGASGVGKTCIGMYCMQEHALANNKTFVKMSGGQSYETFMHNYAEQQYVLFDEFSDKNFNVNNLKEYTNGDKATKWSIKHGYACNMMERVILVSNDAYDKWWMKQNYSRVETERPDGSTYHRPTTMVDKIKESRSALDRRYKRYSLFIPDGMVPAFANMLIYKWVSDYMVLNRELINPDVLREIGNQTTVWLLTMADIETMINNHPHNNNPKVEARSLQLPHALIMHLAQNCFDKFYYVDFDQPDKYLQDIYIDPLDVQSVQSSQAFSAISSTSFMEGAHQSPLPEDSEILD